MFALVIAGLLPLFAFAAAPAWWAQRGVTVASVSPDDYAPANQGQLKNIAKAAVAEMDAKLSGGAGDELHDLVNGWSIPSPQTNDFAPLNIGQLKNVVRPFYDRLIAAGLATSYPWSGSSSPADDFAAANIGQVKNLFTFEINAGNILDGSLGNRLAATQIAGSLALEASAIWMWGDPAPDGSGLRREIPIRVSGLGGISSVSGGDRHFAVLRNDGLVLTWGENAAGQLGDGTTSNRSGPAPVPNLASIISVKAGAVHTLALQQDGTVLAWGDNYYGQLGTGDTIGSTTPVPVVGLPSLIQVRQIAAGPYRSMALMADGTVWTWGYQHYDNGQDVFNPIPVQVSDLTDVVDLAAGYEHTVAVKSDGSVWAWGSNYSNQIANGNPWWNYQATPFQVPNLASIIKVAAGFDHTLALAEDGTVWAWGRNDSGELGDGTTQARQAPVQVTGLTDVIAIAATWGYSLAMKSDGTVWTWGDLAAGTLAGSDKHLPQQVGLGLFDTNGNGMDDRWEIEHFGDLNQTGDADFDGDGVSNLQEYLRGTDPTDYFNGTTPLIEMVSGNNQFGDPGTFLTQPFKVRVRGASNQLLVNAPVTFSISSGSGGLALTPGGPQQPSIVARTNASGETIIYHVLPDAAGTSTRTTASAGSAAPVSVAFRSVVKLSPTPTPAPTPDPDGTPTPTPTATPTAPYRYAIIDLGIDSPKRINNKGTVLVEAPDPNNPNGWGYGRWRAGQVELLSYSGPSSSWNAVDISDNDTVVGSFSRADGPFEEDVAIELQGGLRWPGNRATADALSAPGAFPGFSPHDWYLTFKTASITAINNSDDAYGQMATGSVMGFLFSRILVMNSAVWSSGSSSPAQLSDAAATSDDWAPFGSRWSGSIDTIARASKTHYIGRKFTPETLMVAFPFYGGVPGSEGGMIDGQPADFGPVDVNDGGVVVGNRDSSLVIRTLVAPPLAPAGDVTIAGDVWPIAVNDHVKAPASETPPQSSPAPTPMRAPQILSWDGAALVLRERQPDGTWYPFSVEEMIPSMDGWEYLDPQDINDGGIIVGNAWFTDPKMPGAQGESHGFMLVPVGFYARDGKVVDGKLVEPINQGFDPRPGQDGRSPWASVVKGKTNESVKLVLPQNAADLKLFVVDDGSGTDVVDVMPKEGLKPGDNDIQLIGKTSGGDSVTTTTIEVRQGNETGNLVAKLHVMVLPPRKVSLGIYRIQASASSDQEVGGPSNTEIKTLLDDVYKQAGIEFEIVTPQSPAIIIAYDTYNSPPAATPGDGRVQPEEYGSIVSDSRVADGKMRVFLAANSGVPKDDSVPPDQTEFARGDTPQGGAYSFVFTKTGHNSNLIATLNVSHELGHVLRLSVAALLDNANHDLGPFPPETIDTFGGVMHPGKGTDQPGLWLPHEDWEQANTAANNFLYQ